MSIISAFSIIHFNIVAKVNHEETDFGGGVDDYIVYEAIGKSKPSSELGKVTVYAYVSFLLPF
jgi:hypothetical protein